MRWRLVLDEEQAVTRMRTVSGETLTQKFNTNTHTAADVNRWLATREDPTARVDIPTLGFPLYDLGTAQEAQPAQPGRHRDAGEAKLLSRQTPQGAGPRFAVAALKHPRRARAGGARCCCRCPRGPQAGGAGLIQVFTRGSLMQAQYRLNK
jgi:hypothetical protein